tara:strand:- start:10887 stop:11924 length:1038 start_codon:yes stop_codon:yes gene_type:complete
MKRRGAPKPPWFELPDEELLNLRLKDIPLSIDGTWLETCLNRLGDELRERGLKVRPHAWISHEWFSPDHTSGIAIPFYLAHPRLMELERKMVLDVEGGTPSECMRILRHEAGHVIQHSFALHRRRRWQKQFGLSSTRYPEFYKPDPASRNFVQHLPRWYAQSHPDEDFAETFAVWLTPKSNWRKRFSEWPAIQKIQYVDELMGEISGAKPLLTRRLTMDPLNKLTSTLREHYARKLQHYGLERPTTFDRNLHRIFPKTPRPGERLPATSFIRKNRAEIRQLAAEWTGEHQVNLDIVLDDIMSRCRVLKLRAASMDDQAGMNSVALLTAKTVNSFYNTSRRQWYAL